MEISQHHQVLLSRLVQGEGWKSVMVLVGERLTSLELQLQQMSMDPDYRLALLERRNELLDFVRRVYAQTDEANPFDAAAGALWTTTLRVAPTPVEDAAEHEEEPLFERVPRPQRGGRLA